MSSKYFDQIEVTPEAQQYVDTYFQLNDILKEAVDEAADQLEASPEWIMEHSSPAYVLSHFIAKLQEKGIQLPTTSLIPNDPSPTK